MHSGGVLVFLLVTICAGQLAERDANTADCMRDCNGQPQTCQYTLELEGYSTMSKACLGFPFLGGTLDTKPEECVTGDGVVRHILAANRSLPAPQIWVCEGDTVRVKVKNLLEDGMGTSMHWHGIYMKNEVYMDGVAMVTQCPILPGDHFIYEFKASPPGTHFYHAHVGMQRGEGIAGALVVMPKKRIHSANIVDKPDTTLVIQDWFNSTAASKGISHLHDSINNHPESIIVNGVGTGVATRIQNKVLELKEIPHRVFNVTQNKTYRFRIISNAVMNCPIEIYIANHTLEVIATDGADIKPQKADAVVVSGGERWDFLLHANQPTNKNYWMYFRGLADCAQQMKRQTLAVIHYPNTPSLTPSQPALHHQSRPSSYEVVNPFMAASGFSGKYSKRFLLTDLKPYDPVPQWLKDTKAPRRVFLDIGLNQLNISKYHHIPYACYHPYFSTPNPLKDDLVDGCSTVAQIDNISGMLPPNSMYGQYHDIDQNEVCEVGSLKPELCRRELCECIHVLKVNKGETIELVVVDYGRYFDNSNHPMHLHGHHFHVVALDQESSTFRTWREKVQEELKKVDLVAGAKNAIKKDTVMMPVGGYVVMRFKADNPGPWLFHCHNELHVEQGMFMVVQVGEPDEWPQWPSSLGSMHPCGPYKDPTTTPPPTTSGPYKDPTTTPPPTTSGPQTTSKSSAAAESSAASLLFTMVCAVSSALRVTAF